MSRVLAFLHLLTSLCNSIALVLQGYLGEEFQIRIFILFKPSESVIYRIVSLPEFVVSIGRKSINLTIIGIEFLAFLEKRKHLRVIFPLEHIPGKAHHCGLVRFILLEHLSVYGISFIILL